VKIFKEILIESVDIAISLLVVIIGLLFIIFTLAWFEWFIPASNFEDWIYTLKWIFIIFGFITILFGVKRFFQNLNNKN
jgi:TRAP-type C4-dicarboxylate transport system permease small subunit